MNQCLISLLFVHMCYSSGSSTLCPQDEPKSRIRKVTVLHARAADLVESFGGNVLRESTSSTLEGFRGRRTYGGESAGMLPDPAPEAIVALEVDNTILIKGSDES